MPRARGGTAGAVVQASSRRIEDVGVSREIRVAEDLVLAWVRTVAAGRAPAGGQQQARQWQSRLGTDGPRARTRTRSMTRRMPSPGEDRRIGQSVACPRKGSSRDITGHHRIAASPSGSRGRLLRLRQKTPGIRGPCAAFRRREGG